MTSFKLKIIALSAMIVDHIGRVLFMTLRLDLAFGINVPDIFNWIGRLAFPIYAFLIAEGCRKTRSMPKFIGRLALFMVISEPFYRLAFDFYLVGSTPWEYINHIYLSMLRFRYSNVFTTLMLGAVSVYLYQLLVKHNAKWYVIIAAAIPVGILFMFASSYAHADYEGYGVLLIFLLYFIKSRKLQLVALFIWCCVFYLGWATYNGRYFNLWHWDYWVTWAAACASIIPIAFYNGERGTKLKWSFYVVYPVHLLMLAIIALIFPR